MSKEVDLNNIAQSVKELERLPWTGNPLAGYTEGERTSLKKGVGYDYIGSREYEFGDDMRYLDWNATARSTDGTLYVKEMHREITPTLWIVSDALEHRYQANPGRTERELSVGVAIATMLMARRHNMPVGMTWSNGLAIRTFMPTGDKQDIMRGLRTAVDMAYDSDAAVEAAHAPQKRKWFGRKQAMPESGQSEQLYLKDLLKKFGSYPTAASGIVVISDFRDIYNPYDKVRGWQQPLRQLAHNHDVTAVELTNRTDFELSTGTLLRDPHSGELLPVEHIPNVQERYKQQTAEHAQNIANAIKTAGAYHVTLDTADDEWPKHLNQHIEKLQRAS